LLSVSCKMKGETSQISTRLLKTGHDKIWYNFHVPMTLT
jgi:hypothetical protein